MIQVALYGLFGATLSSLLGGAWWASAAAGCLLIAGLGVVRVDIGAGVVGVPVVLEIAVLAALIAGGQTHPAAGFTLAPLNHSPSPR